MMFYDALCGEDWIKAGFMDRLACFGLLGEFMVKR